MAMFICRNLGLAQRSGLQACNLRLFSKLPVSRAVCRFARCPPLSFLSWAEDDWDEDAPFQIPDPASSMPSGWLEDEPLKIADPSSKRCLTGQAEGESVASEGRVLFGPLSRRRGAVVSKGLLLGKGPWIVPSQRGSPERASSNVSPQIASSHSFPARKLCWALGPPLSDRWLGLGRKVEIQQKASHPEGRFLD